MPEYTIALSSVTTAARAKELLRQSGIDARITRLLPGMTEKGCAWGVSFFAAMEREQIEMLLRRGRVRYSEVFSTQMKRHGGERGR